MSNNNMVAKRPTFSVTIQKGSYQKMINDTLGDPNRAKRFVGSITSAVAVNPALQECTAPSILAGALLGESLNLSPSTQLGQFYLVPFKDKKAGNVKAQFVLGYKGYLQLAMRSGQVKKINVVEIKEGELVKFDPLNEEIECHIIDDFDEREKAETIGYYAFFELLNGFKKAMYWSKSKMLSHADKYSPAFSRATYEAIKAGSIPDKDLWKYSSFWYKDFDDMAKKTMLRQLISKGGCPMSTELIEAFDKDNSVLKADSNNNIVSDTDIEIDGTDVAHQTTETESEVEEMSLDSLE